ncbi:hypothetical protein [Hydrotalea lipotrueae]|uniref:hypothetical protein n=1 Tax=Hydrotalea lipotrueae TaxID=2803817 RepID=UPI001C44D371|nr:hypothetical protein [Hydrotalea lipotrueae]
MSKLISSQLLYFVGFTLINLLTFFYSQTFILTDDLYRLIAGSQMTDRQFDDYLEFVHKWQWVSYLFIPLALLLRISFTWVCLKAGSFITERFTKAAFWKICIQAEILFAVGAVAGLLYTEFFVDVETLEQLSVNPFSLQVFFSDSVPKWSSYFFNTLNIFELSYILFLAYLITEESKMKFLPSLKFVASTYLPGITLWVLLVSYLSVVFQP